MCTVTGYVEIHVHLLYVSKNGIKKLDLEIYLISKIFKKILIKFTAHVNIMCENYKDMSYLVTTCKKQMYIYMFCE